MWRKKLYECAILWERVWAIGNNLITAKAVEKETIMKDLGYPYDDMPCCLTEASSQKNKPKKHYPRVTLPTKEPLDLPDSGTITFKFEKKAVEMRKNDDGDTKYECSLQLTDLVSSEGPKKAKRVPAEETEDALDSIAKEY